MKLTFRPQSLKVAVNPASVGVGFGNPVARDYITDRDPYEGSYTITPSAEPQTLSTNGLRMTDDITIAPIPSNYGLITYNGSVITVS